LLDEKALAWAEARDNLLLACVPHLHMIGSTLDAFLRAEDAYLAALPPLALPSREAVEALARWGISNDCEGESGNCRAQMERQDDGDYFDRDEILALYVPTQEAK